MAKNFELSFGNYFYEKVTIAIRTRKDIIVLLLEAIKVLSLGKMDTKEEKGKIVIKIGKMSRIFFEIENKLFSFNFPFSILKQDDYFRIFENKFNIEINNKIISDILALMSENIFDMNSLEDFLCQIESPQDMIENEKTIMETWIILKKLISFECGYLRYDYDDSERCNGDIHPINHYDIFFSNSNTFKIGLNSKIRMDSFVDLLDVETNCHYIK